MKTSMLMAIDRMTQQEAVGNDAYESLNQFDDDEEEQNDDDDGDEDVVDDIQLMKMKLMMRNKMIKVELQKHLALVAVILAMADVTMMMMMD